MYAMPWANQHKTCIVTYLRIAVCHIRMDLFLMCSIWESCFGARYSDLTPVYLSKCLSILINLPIDVAMGCSQRGPMRFSKKPQNRAAKRISVRPPVRFREEGIREPPRGIRGSCAWMDAYFYLMCFCMCEYAQKCEYVCMYFHPSLHMCIHIFLSRQENKSLGIKAYLSINLQDWKGHQLFVLGKHEIYRLNAYTSLLTHM